MKKSLLSLSLGAALSFLMFAATAPLRSAERKWQLPPEQTKLKPGPGADLVTANCLLCHSADYLSTQPVMNSAAWQAIVVKMREKFGAPLPENKVPDIVNYLATNYGKAK
jgi:hypothetical protein